MAITINCETGPITIYNVYNDGKHSNDLVCLDEHLKSLSAEQTGSHKKSMIWLGDFNRHHPLWDEDRNTHLFTAANLDAAHLLDLLAMHDMKMALPKDIPSLEAMNIKNYTRPDNVLYLSELLDAFIKCTTAPES